MDPLEVLVGDRVHQRERAAARLPNVSVASASVTVLWAAGEQDIKPILAIVLGV